MFPYRALLFIILLSCCLPTLAAVTLFIGEPRQAYYLTESFPLGLYTTEAIAGPLTLAAQRLDDANPAAGPTVFIKEMPVSLRLGETLLWEVQASALRAGTYRFTAKIADQTATLGTVTIVSPVLTTNFLLGTQASAETNAGIGGNWAPVDLYNYSKLAGDGTYVADPLTPSGYEQGMNALIARGVRGFVWQGLWSGYVVHQPYLPWGSYTDPELAKVAMQRAELGAQQARRFLPAITLFSGMDEPGLGYGVVPEGKFAGQLKSTYPDQFQREAYRQATGITLPADPRTLTMEQWLKWFRWRGSIIERFCSDAKARVKRVDGKVPFTQDIYASAFLNDGAQPFNARPNDVPTTHSFMFWAGPPEQNWNFLLERAARRDKRFNFASNTTCFYFNNPAEAPLGEMVTNYGLMDGVGALWHLSIRDPKNFAASFRRVARYGDFINMTIPDTAEVGVLYAFTEVALRLKYLDDADNNTYYTTCGTYAQTVAACYRTLRRAGYLTDILHEEEIPDGGLVGRKAVWVVGQHHRLPAGILAELSKFVKNGGKVFCDAGTEVKGAGLETIAIPVAGVTFADYPAWRAEREKQAQALLAEKKYLEASKLVNQAEVDGYFDRMIPTITRGMAALKALPELERDRPSLIWGKWVAGEGRYYCLLNDEQRLPAEPDTPVAEDHTVKVFAIGNWAAAKGVPITLHELKRNEAVYVIEGTDWQQARVLPLQEDKPQALDFAPTEMKILCVLPEAINGISATATYQPNDGGLRLSATVVGRRQNVLQAPVPLEVTITDPAGEERYHVFRATRYSTTRMVRDESCIYSELFPLGLNDLPGRWQVRIAEMLSGRSQVLEVSVAPRGDALQPAGTRVFDAGAIRNLLRAGQPITVVIGDAANPGEKEIARQLAQQLSKLGMKATAKEEAAIRRKGRYPKVFPAVQQVNGTDGDTTKQWKDLTIAERDAKRQEWAKLENWAGGYGAPPTLPDAYEVDDHLILVGTDASSTLIQALQRGSTLPRVANDYFPGKGRGLVEYAWSPFALGKDVILVTGSDTAGVLSAVEELLKTMK